MQYMQCQSKKITGIIDLLNKIFQIFVLYGVKA